jgi:hypothetical protein
MLIYPKLTPPEFKVSHIETNSIHIIFSKREGLQEFVRGLLQGLGNYMVRWLLWNLQSRNEGSSHEVLK